MGPGAPDRDACRLPQGAEGESAGRVGSGAMRQRYQGGTDRHRKEAKPVGNRVRRHSRPLKSGGTAEGPAFRPGRTKAGYVLFGPGTRPKESGGSHRGTDQLQRANQVRARRRPVAARLLQHRGRPAEPPPPPLHPGTGQPIGPADLAPLFPMELIKQEVSTEREIEIPEPVRDVYRAVAADAALPRASAGAGARYAGAHLLQVRGRQPGRQPQAQHRRRAGVLQQAGGRDAAGDRDRRRPVGQRAGVRRRALRPRGQGLHGARQLRPEAVPARADGDLRRERRRQPEPGHRATAARARRRTRTTRALGIAISEAVEDAATRDDTKYSLGSVLNHVLLHQTVIGQEAIEQMAMAGDYPDIIIGCAGGGSNFAGLAFPFLGRSCAARARTASSRSSRRRPAA